MISPSDTTKKDSKSIHANFQILNEIGDYMTQRHQQLAIYVVQIFTKEIICQY